MNKLWIAPPLFEQPQPQRVAALRDNPLLRHADHICREHTGVALETAATTDPQSDWIRSRVRSLATWLAEARRDLKQGAPIAAVTGLGLGAPGALALAGCLSDEQALDLLWTAAAALAGDTHGFILGVAASANTQGLAVEVSRDTGHAWLEGNPASMAETLGALRAAGVPVMSLEQGPVGAARRAAALRHALGAQALAQPTYPVLDPCSGAVLSEARQLFCDAPFDVPGMRAARVSPVSARPPSPPDERESPLTPDHYLGTLIEREASSFVSERRVSLAEDPYLRTAARLKGNCVLPGSFELEIGMEAGLCLHPQLVPARIEQAVFHSAMKLFEDQPVTMRLHASSKPLGDGSHEVSLRITSDLVHRSGQLLKRDREHCEMRIVMATAFETPPAPLAFDETGATSDPDVPAVLYQPRSPLWLGEYFEAVWDTRRSGQTVQSTYRNPADLTLPAFGRHYGAPCLMDAILQNPLRQSGPYLAVGIPASIQRVRLFERLTERDIVERHGHLLLSSLVDDGQSYCERMQASTPAGKVVMEVERFELIPLGWIDRRDLSVHAQPPGGDPARQAQLRSA